jgi:hypothetical protein
MPKYSDPAYTALPTFDGTEYWAVTKAGATYILTGSQMATYFQGSWFVDFTPLDNVPPSTNFATPDFRNGHPVLNFDTTTQETAMFMGILPASYSGGGVIVTVYAALASATSGTVGWDVSFERMDAASLDIDADSFATAQTITATTVPGSSGQLSVLSVSISNGANMDSLAAGEAFRLRIRRDVANDTATGDAQLLRVRVRPQ